MRHSIILLFAILCLTACGATINEASPPTEIDLNEGMGDTAEDGYQSDEEILVESRMGARNNFVPENGYTRLQAEGLVKKHFGITDRSSTIVTFDHEENDQYIIRVQDLTNNDRKYRTQSVNGLYRVDPKTGKVTKYKN